MGDFLFTDSNKASNLRFMRLILNFFQNIVFAYISDFDNFKAKC
jgi:hypothetical protein